MKKYLLLLILAIAGFQGATRAAAQVDSTVIEGFIEGLTPGTIKLVGIVGDQNYIADTAIVDASGHFTLRRKSPLLSGYYYFLMSTGKNFSILLDEGEQFVTLRASVKDFSGYDASHRIAEYGSVVPKFSIPNEAGSGFSINWQNSLRNSTRYA